MKKSFKITGVDCANCASKMEDRISKLDGVNSCSLSFVLQKLTLDCDDDKFDSVLEKAGSIVKKIDRDARIVSKS